MPRKWTGCLISTTNHSWIRSKLRPEPLAENSTLNCDPRRDDRAAQGWLGMLPLPSGERVAAGMQPLERAVRGKFRPALLAVRSEALLHVGAREPEKLQGQRGVKNRAGGAQPIVERIFGPADGAGRAFGESHRDLDRFGVELRILHRQRDEPDPLRLGSRQRV